MTQTAVGPFRCSLASVGDGEPLAGTAPTETRWVLVEQPGAWTPKAADELAIDGVEDGVRVQLIRRVGGGATPGGRRVFRADLVAGVVETALVGDDLDLAAADWRPHAAPLWLVCTHGRRDVCCAEFGRPVAAALAARWPDDTWETSHLGGHRFAPTLIALPSGVTLGRVGAADAVPAAERILSGRLPDLALVRGRAGQTPVAQAADLHVRAAHGLDALDAVGRIEVDGDVVRVHLAGGTENVRVTATSTRRRQSCGDDKQKPAAAYAVSEV
ncbi:sucrase ferredoxin [Nocardioides fonticola]|uniref:Sucrase ferredoxin n=1 Tax=Nocardioides fonticola TaxID=450363 RepID=A0ABP7XQA3_9ACTN